MEVTSKLDDGVISSGQSIILDGNLTYKHGSAEPLKVKVKLCKDEGSARKECSWLTRMQGQVREVWCAWVCKYFCSFSNTVVFILMIASFCDRF